MSDPFALGAKHAKGFISVMSAKSRKLYTNEQGVRFMESFPRRLKKRGALLPARQGTRLVFSSARFQSSLSGRESGYTTLFVERVIPPKTDTLV